MSCPFPGMDPYLEMPPYWGDFAQKFLGRIGDSLLRQVFPEYDVCLEEYVLVMSDGEPTHRVRPDVTVTEASSWTGGHSTGTATATAAAVLDAVSTELAYPDIEPETQRRINVIHRQDKQVVTVLEFLSPANKRPGEDAFFAYLAKRNELIASNVNFVEMDLLRGGKRLPMRGDLPAGDYYVFIGRGVQRPHCEVITWSLQASLPTIPIPLLPRDGDVALDLADVFRQTYESAIFDRRLPYDEPLQPRPDDRLNKWIAERLAERSV